MRIIHLHVRPITPRVKLFFLLWKELLIHSFLEVVIFALFVQRSFDSFIFEGCFYMGFIRIFVCPKKFSTFFCLSGGFDCENPLLTSVISIWGVKWWSNSVVVLEFMGVVRIGQQMSFEGLNFEFHCFSLVCWYEC